MRYLSKEAIRSRLVLGHWASIKVDHPGPRGRNCLGGEVRISYNLHRFYNQGVDTYAFCPGCGYQDIITRNKK